MIFIIYMVYRAYTDVITEESLYIINLPQSFQSARIFFIADVHRRKIKKQTLHSIENIDYVFLGGDMIEGYVPLKRLAYNLDILSRWGVPIFFVAGNNDYEKGEQRVKQLLQQFRITILEDDVAKLTKDDDSLYLAGMPYMEEEEERQFDFSLLEGSNHLLLCHSPYSYYHLNTHERAYFSYVFAGHTHGGQIRIFSFGPYKPGGWRHDQETSIFITEGYGYSLLPFRLGTKAQCHVFTLYGK